MSESVTTHRARSRGDLGFAVLTVSDSRTAATDRGGPLVAELAAAGGHRVAARRLVADERTSIADAVRALVADPAVDVVIATGGTGLAPRDVTPEAVEPLYERAIPGFGELFRQLSYAEVGPAAMLSRASAGVVAGRLVFLLPGSPHAVRLAMERLILPEVGHLAGHLSPEARGGGTCGAAEPAR